MSLITLRENDQIMMSLVHYFVTQENYTPINVQGVKDEIWLENLEGPYRVIRISCNTIINEEQYKFDIFKMKHILKQIKRKTLSFKVNALNICLDVSGKVKLDIENNIESIKIDSLKDAKKNEDLVSIFPGLKEALIEAKDSIDLIVNVTNDINAKTEKENKRFAKIFSPKKIVITPILITICVAMFILTEIVGSSTSSKTLLAFGALNGIFVQSGQIWRIVTSAFLHIGLIHLIVNMYSLFIIGNQVETYLGKWRYLIIYLVSAITGSLLSLAVLDVNVVSAGASGAIFGLMGALLYFGYHYRLYLNDALRNQIVPIIILNLLIGFMNSTINNAAHIGGLIGGYLITMAIGIDGKSTKKDRMNGWIVLLLYIIFLSAVIFGMK